MHTLQGCTLENSLVFSSSLSLFYIILPTQRQHLRQPLFQLQLRHQLPLPQFLKCALHFKSAASPKKPSQTFVPAWELSRAKKSALFVRLHSIRAYHLLKCAKSFSRTTSHRRSRWLALRPSYSCSALRYERLGRGWRSGGLRASDEVQCSAMVLMRGYKMDGGKKGSGCMIRLDEIRQRARHRSINLSLFLSIFLWLAV